MNEAGGCGSTGGADRTLQLFGLARRAQRLSMGHDAALASVLRGKAKLCLVCADASPRLLREFERAARDRAAPVLRIRYTMAEVGGATGMRAGVFTIDDEGFARKAREQIKGYDGEEF